MSGTFSSQQSGFVNSMLPYAVSASNSTGLPVDFILSQSALETGWGTSSAAMNENNYFGVSPGGSIASYGTPADSFSAYADLMGSPRYAGAISSNLGNGPLALGSSIQQAGYTPNSNYGSAIASIVPTIDQILQGSGNAQYATGGSTGGSSSAQNASGSCGFSPSCWLTAVASWAGSYLLRGSFFLLAFVLIAGAIYLFGKRTELAPG